MLFSTIITFAVAGFAAALPAKLPRASSCEYPTFKLVNPLYGEWASGKYAMMKGDNTGDGNQFWFHTNQSSDATVFTLNAATGQLFTEDSVAYWLGHQNQAPAVHYTAPSSVGDGSTVTCDTPTANGDTFTCSADSSGVHKQFNMCWGNEGGIGLELVYGNSTGPFPTPYYIDNWLYCGGVRVEVDDLGCGSAPA